MNLSARLELAGGEFVVEVDLSIEEGWHTFAKVPASRPAPTTQVSFEFPVGMRAAGELLIPAGVPSSKEAGTELFEGSVTFSQPVTVVPSVEAREIGVQVDYQVCNDQLCYPPQSLTTTIRVPASGSEGAGQGEAKFGAPEMLRVGEVPLNSKAKKMYPSPALYDVDGNGRDELIVGESPVI